MSQRSRPSIRAAWTRGILEYYERNYDERRTWSCLQALAPQTLRAIRTMSELDWLPIAQHIEFLEALLADTGPAEFVALYRRGSLELMHSPLLRTTAVSGVRVFGRRAILRVLPRAWNLVVRDCGKLGVSRHASRNCTQVTLRAIPADVAASRAIELCVAAVLAGACDLGGFPGRVQIERERPSPDAFQYYVSLYGEPEFRQDDPEVALGEADEAPA